jgi:hypothetical protein
MPVQAMPPHVAGKLHAPVLWVWMTFWPLLNPEETVQVRAVTTGVVPPVGVCDEPEDSGPSRYAARSSRIDII